MTVSVSGDVPVQIIAAQAAAENKFRFRFPPIGAGMCALRAKRLGAEYNDQADEQSSEADFIDGSGMAFQAQIHGKQGSRGAAR